MRVSTWRHVTRRPHIDDGRKRRGGRRGGGSVGRGGHVDARDGGDGAGVCGARHGSGSPTGGGRRHWGGRAARASRCAHRVRLQRPFSRPSVTDVRACAKASCVRARGRDGGGDAHHSASVCCGAHSDSSSAAPVSVRQERCSTAGALVLTACGAGWRWQAPTARSRCGRHPRTRPSQMRHSWPGPSRCCGVTRAGSTRLPFAQRPGGPSSSHLPQARLCTSSTHGAEVALSAHVVVCHAHR
jgi:hypothetical protein